MSFGGFGGFGSQQNTSSPFGGFGASNNNNNANTTTGFGTSPGLFGSSNTGNNIFGGAGLNNSTNTGTGGFGGFNKPAFGAATTTGGSLFGSTTATTAAPFGGGGFGSTTTPATSSPFGGSLFGGSKPAFGTGSTGSGLFGGANTANPTPAFGSTPSFGAVTNPGIGTNVGDPPGTAAVAFQPLIEKEAASNQQNSFQNILFMDNYKKWSAEELRLADYNQGRRYGNATGAGAFGVGSGLGGFGANNTNNANTGLFGNAANNNPFGTASNTNTAGGFGTGSNLFGTKSATTGNLFGATNSQPAQGGGLFGNTGGSFGAGTTAGGFGANNNATTGGSLFSNAANQNKPAGGFGGFGTPAQGATPFGSSANAGAFGTPATNTNTGGGLFGNAANTASGTGGSMFGAGQTPAANNAFGANTNTGAFGTPQNQGGSSLFGATKPAGSLFGGPTSTTTTPAGGGSLFSGAATSSPFGANNAAQPATGSPFAKPGQGLNSFGTYVPPNTAGTAAGGMFGTLGQNNQAQQQPQQGQSLFGNALNANQNKTPLFGQQPTANTGGSLFGNTTGGFQQQSGSLFANSNNAAGQQQANAFGGGSLFGNSAQGTNSFGTQPALTTSIGDAGAYGAPSLFQSLTTNQVNNPGPLATPLSAAKAKTSRRSSILPLYKMNPGSATKYATPQKRGYGLSYSAFGTPTSVSSAASTPGSFGKSLLAGSVSRGLAKSISSSNLRQTYNAGETLLLPGAFSASTGPRYYGSTGSKKLVINRDMRADLFSTPSKTGDANSNEPPSSVALLGGSRKLTKRVSFDTATAKSGVSGSSNTTNGSSAAGGGLTNGHGAAAPAPEAAGQGSGKPEMEQVSGNKELTIVHEEDSSSPFELRCMPADYAIDNRDVGDYWMSPSKDAIERMNRVQRQSVADYTVGRMNVGQIRFLVPVDLSKINLDSILGGLVKLEIRSATVYPDIAAKPPVGQGLNVPAEIVLLHTCPRSGANVPPAKIKKHVLRLKATPGTQFISYDEKTATWTFSVDHFTTYGFDEDDDETDAELSTHAGEPTSAAAASAVGAAVTAAADADGAVADDTFDFRRRKRVFVPGAFDNSYDLSDDDETPQQSFLSSGSADANRLAVQTVEMTEDDNADEQGHGDELMGDENEAFYSTRQHPSAEHHDILDSLEDTPPNGAAEADMLMDTPELPAGILRARLRAMKEANTPLKIQVADGDNWMDMLQKTVSPQKRDRAALRALNEGDDVAGAGAGLDGSASTSMRPKKDTAAAAARQRAAVNDSRGFATSIDLMNSLFEHAKAPPSAAPQAITPAKGFVKWPYKTAGKAAKDDGKAIDADELAFHSSLKPVWSADGTCIVSDGIEQRGDVSESILKRIRVFDSVDLDYEDDPIGTIPEHKNVVDIEVVNGIPAVSTRRVPPIEAFLAFSEQANQRRAGNAHPRAKKLGMYEQSVWNLASVLFGPLDGDQQEQLSGAAVARMRRENLGRFWAQLVQESAAKSLEQTLSLEEKAIVYLSLHKVPEACRALVDSNNYKAATLVALIGSSDVFKRDMREQEEGWRQGDVLAEFGVALRAIYSMLAGNVAVCEGKKGSGVENRMESVVVSERFGLDWKQAFGLRLWFGIASGDGIEAAVAKYVEDMEQGRVPVPRPWYANAAAAGPAKGAEERHDLLFGLLKVAAGLARLEEVLEPENSRPSAFRFRLSWQLNQALGGVATVAAAAKLTKAKADALTVAYAAELVYDRQSDNSESGGDLEAWPHAIWVLLHLADRTGRTRAIQDVLGRQARLLFVSGSSSRGVALYERLVDELKIPAAWVWQAAALHWRSQKNQAALEAECLLRAAAFGDAHRIFVKQLAPRAIVARQYDGLAEMLAKLQPQRHKIADWPLGGEVYERFLDLVMLQRSGGGGGTHHQGDSSQSGGVSGGGGGGAATRTRGRQQQALTSAEQAVARLTAAVEALVVSLPAMYEKAGDAGPTEVAAITEMADVVAHQTMALASKGRMDLSTISRLPLTEDRRLRYTTDLAFAYYRETMAAH